MATKNTPSFPKTLIIGSSGFIGHGIIDRWQEMFDKDLIITPSESDLNILDSDSIQKFISENNPKIIINLAAITNLEAAEKERGNRNGFTWQLNAKAPENLARICSQHAIFLIQISTDAVFPGTSCFPGPYTEETVPPDNPTPLSWYAYTKLTGEKAVSENLKYSAIVRISYPFGNLESERDFIKRTLKYIQNGYPLFTDQKFTPTFTPDINSALEIIVKNKLSGIFHVVCKGLTTPYLFGVKIANKLNLGKVKEGSAIEYLKKPDTVPRPVLGGLTTKQTEYKLEIELSPWENAIDKALLGFKL
jgi:dTDP-4-dehydrorhamnose reductase